MLRQLNNHDIEYISNELNALVDAKVQNVFATDDSIGIELYKAKSSYIWFYLNQRSPQIFTFDKVPKVFKLKKTSPVLLFLKAHLIGKRLNEVLHDPEKGRVLTLTFGYEQAFNIEVRLFPHGANLIANFEDKKISFNKVKELKSSSPDQASSQPDDLPVRTLTEISEQFLNQKVTVSTQKDPQVIKQKLISKKQNALVKMKSLLSDQTDDKWKELGLWLTSNQKLNVPKKFEGMIPPTMKFSEAVQFSFEKSKKNSAKTEGTKSRIAALEREILQLEHSQPRELEKSVLKKKTDAWTGYRLNLSPKCEVFVGKNAKENLTILRHAQSWDYWLHVKDYPGAHGIVRRPRGHELEDAELVKAAQFVASRSKKSAHFLSSGDVLDVLVVERRYVKPIKGDKLGRVTFNNERVLQIKMP